MDRLHFGLTVAALCTMSCRVVPEPPSADAGLENGAEPAAEYRGVAVGPTSAPPDLYASTGRYVPPRRRHSESARPSSHRFAPPDPRVVHCAQTEGQDKAHLMSCLDGLRAEFEAQHQALAADAGHRYGAIRPPPVNPVWSVPEWDVNFSTGSDLNAGTTSGAPLKTLQELIARWGTSCPQISTTVAIHYHASDTTNWSLLCPQIVNGGGLWIIGDTTTLASGTLGTVTAKDRTRAVKPELQADLGSAASFAVGHMVVNSTRSSSVAWGDSVSGTVVTLTQPMAANAPAAGTHPASFPAEIDTWASGDSFTVVQPTQAMFSRLTPASASGDASQDTIFTFVEDMEVFDPLATSSFSQLHTSTEVLYAQSRVDPYVLTEGPANLFGFVNAWLPAGGQYTLAGIYGGAVGTLEVSGNQATFASSTIDGDVILHGDILNSNGPFQATTFGFVDLETTMDQAGQIDFGPTFLTDPGVTYGTNTIRLLPGSISHYESTATTIFPGVTTWQEIAVGGTTESFASARDYTQSPVAEYPARALTTANLAASIASGGFAGTAYGDNGSALTDGAQSHTAANQWLTAGSGITLSASGTGGISIAATGSGVSSVTGAGATSCSPTTGAVTCTTSNSVPNGLTGNTSFPSGAVLVGASSSAIATAGPCLSGVPLVGNSGGTGTVCGTASVAGGGTGLTNCGSGNLLTGGSPTFGCSLPSALAWPPGGGGQGGFSKTNDVGNPILISSAGPFTTPNDGINHTMLCIESIQACVNPVSGTIWVVKHGIGVDSTTVFDGSSDFEVGFGSQCTDQEGTTQFTTTLAPNSTVTANQLVQVTSLGVGSGGATFSGGGAIQCWFVR